tara:strand:- start:2339 stop:2848 length:510 start_codon:yes stop_codon:yes gene_type:complete
MSNSYLEQCKQAGRELAVKEAMLLTDSLALLGGSAALGAGVKAMSRNKALKTLNRSAGAAGGALAGGGLGHGYFNVQRGGYGPFYEGLTHFKTFGPPRQPDGEAIYYGQGSLFGSLVDHTVTSPVNPVYGVLEEAPAFVVPMLLGGYAGTRLVKGSEKLQPILAKKLRS